MATSLASISIEEGFYPRFAESFREFYGSESVFVYAVADSFTGALARLLEARGKLAAKTVVPRLGEEEASLAVGRLLRAAPSLHKTLLQEAFGALPTGSYGAALDRSLGNSCFAGWFAALQAKDYSTANQSLIHEPQNENAS